MRLHTTSSLRLRQGSVAAKIQNCTPNTTNSARNLCFLSFTNISLSLIKYLQYHCKSCYSHIRELELITLLDINTAYGQAT